jgi:hypothetical protein
MSASAGEVDINSASLYLEFPSTLFPYNILINSLTDEIHVFSVEPGGTLLTQTRTRAFDAVALHQYRAARVFFFFSRLLLKDAKRLNDDLFKSSNAPNSKFPSAGCKNVPQYAIFLRVF